MTHPPKGWRSVCGVPPDEQRAGDGYMDATAMCRANGKLWANYWRNKTTQEFTQALAESMRIRIDSLVETRSGSGGGTYVHPRVATHLAQWCSPRFAVAVSGWVRGRSTARRGGVT